MTRVLRTVGYHMPWRSAGDMGIVLCAVGTSDEAGSNRLWPDLGCTAGTKEGNVLFNDTHNTFYLRLYGVSHMVKNHTDRERKPAAATWVTLSD